ncbi:DUF6188 family protein [Nocardia otitidiscaviarum]|uniref:DUF6188 family protein n=1 Tax=Nocardia otitidiscaviarum TaxID=1823 RepID=UPI0018954C3F|nr:DUF6188 family protein [Nocardia otitidiscaviarum]MBF6239754.1 hypothetical protein [Nocardia otitidiscaviarum]
MELPITGRNLCVLSTEPLLALGVGEYELHIGGELAVETSNGIEHFVVGDPSRDNGDLVVLLDGVITTAAVPDSGGLHLTLDTGRTVVIEPDRYFEAWSLTGPNYLAVSMPGGELAVWSA